MADVTGAPRVLIEIDELDLTAVPPARRHVVAAAFERELARLVGDRTDLGALGIERGGNNADERSARSVRERPDGNPVIYGQALARAVYEALQ